VTPAALQAQVAEILPPILNALPAALGDLLDAAGVRVGGADVFVLSMYPERPSLVR
jgi:uncharacterized membrane protein